jgi:crotonobetainyl-CoA:carnitine CoA-transferase CaiB-like acyl-CoA transferase
LAALGACVIKVEKPSGDSSKKISPFHNNLPQLERSLFFEYSKYHKLGITLNLEHPAGRGIFTELANRTDAVVKTFAATFRF